MTTHREDLLRLLRDAHICGQGSAQLLMVLLERHPGLGPCPATVEDFLSRTLEHQDRLVGCVARIEESTPMQLPERSDLAELSNPEHSGTKDLFREFAHVRKCLSQEIELYSKIIATAEAGGFFETRFICESIHSEKSSMAAWFGLHASHREPPELNL